MLLRLLVFVLLAAVAIPTSADDGAVEGVGGAIQLLDEHASVVMEEMDVVVDLGNAEADVDCTFVFHNTGPACDVQMGFPESGGGDVDLRNPRGFPSFTSWVDGEGIATTIEGLEVGGADWRRWRVKTVHFDPDQRRVVRVAYSAIFGRDSTGGSWFPYEVHTGASWKGPIGRARIRLNLNHDPNRGTYEGHGSYGIDPRFEPCGPRCYEWTAEDFEPSRDDNLSVHYWPHYVSVRALRRAYPAEVAGKYPYIADGGLWLPAQVVAGYGGAAFRVLCTDAILIRGTHFIRLSADSDEMGTETGLQRLPAPTRFEHGCLMVPAAPVLRALGAVASVNAGERAVTISFPEDAPLEARFDDRAIREILAEIPAGWAPPRPESYAAEIRERFPDPDSPPWFAVGDFVGDRADDVALFLQKGDETGIGIVERANGRHFSFHWLPGFPNRDRTFLDGSSVTILQVRAPGEIAYYENIEAPTKSEHLTLYREGLEVRSWMNERVGLWYWDRREHEYRRVTTSD